MTKSQCKSWFKLVNIHTF